MTYPHRLALACKTPNTRCDTHLRILGWLAAIAAALFCYDVYACVQAIGR